MMSALSQLGLLYFLIVATQTAALAYHKQPSKNVFLKRVREKKLWVFGRFVSAVSC
jgi:hypothetical protein